MPWPLLIFSQSGYSIQIIVRNLHTWWQTVQIQISWLLQKPTDLDLHCLQNRVYPGSAGQGLSINIKSVDKYNLNYPYSIDCRLHELYKFQGGQFNWLIFGSICWYLHVSNRLSNLSCSVDTALNFSIKSLTSIIEITPMNAECRLLYKFQGQFSRPVLTGIYWHGKYSYMYLPIFCQPCFLLWRLIMKYFIQSFSAFHDSKRAVVNLNC